MTHEPTHTALVVCHGENVPRVSSRTIAEAFGKNHPHVLRKIKELVASCPDEFSQSNFGLADYYDEQGKPRPNYLLTRDAFSLLVMGFTGPEALSWKLRYIEAFNAMEHELLNQRLLAAPEGRALIRQGLQLARRLTPARRREIKRALHYKSLGLSNTEVGRLMKCGREKVRLLLLDHEWSQGGGQ